LCTTVILQKGFSPDFKMNVAVSINEIVPNN
jgi:hypothetical protein